MFVYTIYNKWHTRKKVELPHSSLEVKKKKGEGYIWNYNFIKKIGKLGLVRGSKSRAITLINNLIFLQYQGIECYPSSSASLIDPLKYYL